MRPIIAVFIVLSFVGLAFSQEMEAAHHPHHFMAGLNLSEEQQAKMLDLQLQHQREALPIRAELKVLRAKLKLAITGDNYNETQVKNC